MHVSATANEAHLNHFYLKRYHMYKYYNMLHPHITYEKLYDCAAA